MRFNLSLFVLLGTAILGLGVERVAVRPMVGRPAFTVAIITLGVDAIVRVVANGFIGINIRQVGDPWVGQIGPERHRAEQGQVMAAQRLRERDP